LKEKLTTATIITAPNWSLDFELMCDASDYAAVVVLGQRKNKIFMQYTSFPQYGPHRMITSITHKFKIK